MTDKILNLRQAAAELGKPPNTLRFWRAQGIGPRSFLLGGRVAYKASDIESWIESQYAAEEERWASSDIA